MKKTQKHAAAQAACTLIDVSRCVCVGVGVCESRTLHQGATAWLS